MKKTIFHVALAAGAVAVVGTALALAFGGSNGASDADQARYVAQDWESKDRDLAFETDRHSWFEYTSSREVNDSRDVVEGRFDLDEATYRLEFKSDPQAGVEGIAPATNESWLVMNLEFVGLVEYHDNTSDGSFNPAADTIVDRVDLDKVGGTQLSVDEPAPGLRFATATFPFPNGGAVEIEFRVSSSTYTLHDQEHRPTVTAVDVVVKDYPFKHDDTNVALHTKVSAPNPLAFDADEERVRVDAKGGDEPFVGRYTWANDLAGTNGTMHPTVIESPPGTGSEATLLFSYPRADHVEHSTAVGVHHDRPIAEQVFGLLGNWYVFGVALVGTLLVLGGSIYVKVRNADAGPPFA